MKTDFFITYHHDDELAARWIADILLKVPYSLFMESWDFLPGGQPLEKIDYMLSRSCSAVVLVSERWLRVGVDASTWQTVTDKYPGPVSPALLLLRINSCDVEQVLGVVTYTDLFGFKAGEAANRLLIAAGAAAPIEKKETFPVSHTSVAGILESRKKELDLLLAHTVKHQYHMTLELETEVKKEVKIKDEKTGRMKKRLLWVLKVVPMERVLTDGNHYLLVNPSGMGKTTYLTHAAGVLLDCTKEYPFVPLLTTSIALNQRSGSIEDFIASQVESLYKNAQTHVVKEDWENLCILIDALDQARDVDDIVSSLHIPNRNTHYKKAKIILSSRQNTAEKVKEGFRKIRLKLPVEDEVRHYLGEENYTKLEGHIKAYREMVTVPVLLEMLKTVTTKGGGSTVLKNHADLYTEFTSILVDQERSKPRFWQDSGAVHHFIENELEQTLEKIAFFSMAENKIMEIDKEMLVKYCGTSDKKETLLNIGILLELFEDREQKIVFRHQSFQAYFAARYMYYRRPDLFQEVTRDISFFYSDIWYEVMRFFIGLEKDPQKASKIINTILIKDSRVHEEIRIKQFLSKQKFSILKLRTKLRLIFAFLLASETTINDETLRDLHKQLASFLSKRNQVYWTAFLSNIDKFNMSNSVQRESLVHIIFPFLRNKHKLIRSSAVKALSNISNFKDIPLLEPLLSDKNWKIRHAASIVLGEIGTVKHIPLLEPLLMDIYPDVRSAAVIALGNIGTIEHISLLKPLLNAGVGIILSAIAITLGKIGTAEHVHIPEPLLNDIYSDVRFTAVMALGNIGTAEHVPLLKPLLRDRSDYVRCAAADALGNIGNAHHVSLLKPLLRANNKFVRQAAVRALGNIGTDEHFPLLKPLRRDRSKDVRIAVADSLEKLKSFDKIIQKKDIIQIVTKKDKDFIWKELFSISLILFWLNICGPIYVIVLLLYILRNIRNKLRGFAYSYAVGKGFKRSIKNLRISLPEFASETKTREIAGTGILPQFCIPPIHILHISDIHYSAESDPSIRHIFYEFLKDIKKWRKQHHNEPIHAICLTGDIAFSGQKDQYASIHERINEILQVTGCSKDNLFVIPGNHDIHEYKNVPEECKKIMKRAVKDETYIDHILSDFEKYCPFHYKFFHYYEYVEKSSFSNSRPETHGGSPKPWYSRRLKGFPVRIIGLNSALFCLKPYTERDKIRMGKRQLEEAYFHEKSQEPENQELVILLTHHPVDWLCESEKDEYTALMDTFSVVHLHGHTHKLEIKEIRSLSGNTYMLIGTGSIYGEKGKNYINTYHIMTLGFENNDIHIWGRRWEPGYGFWTAFADTTRNVFPFPGKHETLS